MERIEERLSGVTIDRCGSASVSDLRRVFQTCGGALPQPRRVYGVGAPPVTDRVLPVVYEDSSEAR